MTEEAQLKALNELLEHCKKAEFYRARLPEQPLRSLEEFRQLPLLTKGELRAHSPYGLVCVPAEELLQYHETFGTTGTPTSNWLTREDIAWNVREVNRCAIDFQPGDRVLIRFPYAISLIGSMVHRAAQEKGALAIAASSRTTVTPFPRVINLMQKLAVTVLAGLPLQTLLLAETAELLNLDPRRDFPSLRAILVGGEPLSEHRRRLIEEIWGVPVFEMYGMTEIGTPVCSCSHGRSHVWEEQFLVEILLDDLQTPAPPGEGGWLVITPLNKRGTPVVRYLTEDRALWLADPCPCGRPAALRILGRKQFSLTIGKRTLDMNDLDAMFSRLPCRRFWAAGPEGDRLKLVVEEETAGVKPNAELIEQLSREYGVPLYVEVVPKGTLCDQQELLAVGEVGKPRYFYSETEMQAKTYLRASKI